MQCQKAGLKFLGADKETFFRCSSTTQIKFESAALLSGCMSPWVEFKSHGKERVSGWMQLDRVKMGWKMARCSCQVSWHTLTVFDSVLLWVCITWTLTNSQWEKRQSRKHVYARGSMHMSSICLCLQNMSNKENIWYAVAYILYIYICVYLWRCVHLCQCSKSSQQCVDGWAAWMTPPVDSGLGARMLVIT